MSLPAIEKACAEFSDWTMCCDWPRCMHRAQFTVELPNGAPMVICERHVNTYITFGGETMLEVLEAADVKWVEDNDTSPSGSNWSVP